MDPTFETPNKAPPTVLNALTWAIHMGISSLSPLAFKTSVVVLRCLNNVLGGMSFVILARLTGSQSVEEPKLVAVDDGWLLQRRRNCLMEETSCRAISRLSSDKLYQLSWLILLWEGLLVVSSIHIVYINKVCNGVCPVLMHLRC
uniref:Uncharacterized protein n=1 Tax=Salix viminalis TaxID=40686 RepID=A0A6N2KJK2_SALVM